MHTNCTYNRYPNCQLHLDKKMVNRKKNIKLLNFGQINLEPPENENRKVPLAKEGTFPLMPPPRNKNIIIPKMAEKINYIFKILMKYTSGF